MKNVLQISYWTIGGFEGAKPAAQALAEAKKMGYDGVELNFGGGELTPDTDAKTCREIRAAADKLGMKIESLATGYYWQNSFSHPSAAVRRNAVAFTKQYLRVASLLEVSRVLVLPGAVFVAWDDKAPVVPYKTAWENATAALGRCLREGREYGVTIALENVWSGFLTDPVAMREFLDQFEDENIGSYFDVGNCLINGFPEHWIELLAERISAVHVKNFSRSDFAGGLHDFGDDLLKGDCNWPAVVKALKKIHYTGPITAEMLPFCRLPDMVLPDLKLARDTAGKLKGIFGR